MVLVRTSTPQRTVSLHVCLACWAIWVETEAVFASEEVAEAEAVGRLQSLHGGSCPLHLGSHGDVAR
jgi:hypothetical protein